MPDNPQTWLFGPSPPSPVAAPRWWSLNVPALPATEDDYIRLDDLVFAAWARTLRLGAALEILPDDALTPGMIERWRDPTDHLFELAKGMAGHQYSASDVPELCRALGRWTAEQDDARNGLFASLSDELSERVHEEARRNRISPMQARREISLAHFLDAEAAGETIEIAFGLLDEE